MRILFTIDNNPKCTLWDGMWSIRTIEQELEATEIETAPRVMFLKYLKKNDKIVDAGCGFGKWVIYLHRLGYNIIGVDNSDRAINKLKEHDNSLPIEYGDILHFNYPDNYFDAYISMGVIEIISELVLALPFSRKPVTYCNDFTFIFIHASTSAEDITFVPGVKSTVIFPGSIRCVRITV